MQQFSLCRTTRCLILKFSPPGLFSILLPAMDRWIHRFRHRLLAWFHRSRSGTSFFCLYFSVCLWIGEFQAFLILHLGYYWWIELLLMVLVELWGLSVCSLEFGYCEPWLHFAYKRNCYVIHMNYQRTEDFNSTYSCHVMKFSNSSTLFFNVCSIGVG